MRTNIRKFSDRQTVAAAKNARSARFQPFLTGDPPNTSLISMPSRAALTAATVSAERQMSAAPMFSFRRQRWRVPGMGTIHGRLHIIHASAICDGVAQVALRRLVQRGVIIIPKSTHTERMRQNIDIFDFSLSDEDMAAITALDTGRSLFFDHHDAETARMFMDWR